MKVIDHIKKASSPIISFEITPPKRGENIQYILGIVEYLKRYNPSFVHVTSRAAEADDEEISPGIFKRVIKRKRPGTIGICSVIQYKYGIDAVCHVLCRGFSREETEDLLIDLNYSGIVNVFAVQGDDLSYRKNIIREDRSVNKHASDLVRQISSMNKGVYLENLLDANPTSFCMGVTGYPEKHYRSPNIQTDLRYLKLKEDNGADYIITQMFFDEEKYFKFLDICQKNKINIPIIPGLKIIVKKSQLMSVPSKFYVEIPYKVSEKISDASEEDVLKFGVECATKLTERLLKKGVPGIHFFIFEKEDPRAIGNVLENLGIKNISSP